MCPGVDSVPGISPGVKAAGAHGWRPTTLVIQGLKLPGPLGPPRPVTGHLYFDVKVKDKAVPLQAWSGPEGSRKLRFPDFMTTAQDGGKVVSLTHRPPLPPGNTPGTHFC